MGGVLERCHRRRTKLEDTQISILTAIPRQSCNPTSSNPAIYHGKLIWPAGPVNLAVPGLFRGVALKPEKESRRLQDQVQGDDQEPDEPSHPTVRQPEQGDGERGLAENHGENRGTGGDVSEDS